MIHVIADITKAFLQISISFRDREFLWCKDTNQNEIVTYRYCPVIFSIFSRLFFLGATIFHHLDNASQDLGGAALTLTNVLFYEHSMSPVQHSG